MRSWLLPYLQCPTCREGDLRVERRDAVAALTTGPTTDEILVSGVLRCTRCDARFPVVDESPRLLAEPSLNDEERAVLSGVAAPPADPAPAARQMTSGEVMQTVRRRIMDDYHHPTSGPTLRRAQADLAYQERYEESRRYQMEFLAGLLPGAPHLIVDVGGGRGGNLRAARGPMRFTYGIVVDMDARWPPVFRTGDRTTVYLRADATRLPLKSHTASLAISSFLLEHVEAWPAVVSEISRIAPTAFVAFGPNRAFPYEFGHLDAPLAHTLPAPLGAFVATLWDQVSGNRRSYGRLREIIREMHWPSSRAYYRYCRARRLPAQNLFADLMAAWAGAGDTGLRARLGRHPALVRTLAKAFSALHLEPNIYSLIRQTD